MRFLRNPYAVLCLLLLTGYLDLSLTRFLNALLELPIQLSSHLFVMVLVVALHRVPQFILVVFLLVVGALYDTYLFDFYPVMMVTLPVTAALGKLLSQKIPISPWSQLLLLIILVFNLEMVSYLLGLSYGMTDYGILPFIIGTIAPTLLLSVTTYFLIVPLLKKLY